MLVFSLFSPAAVGILPLPYPIEPIQFEDETGPLAEESRDPRTIQGFSELYSGSQLREMELPHFDNPSGTLGYVEGQTFRVPAELRPRVDFWKKIYTEYTSSQAVLHDASNLSIIYGVVDFSHIEKDDRLSPRMKRRMINRLLREEKKKIVRDLLALDGARDQPLAVPRQLIPLFKLFEAIPSKDRFLHAVPQVRAQVGQRDRIVRGFFYGGRYFPKMMQIFESYRVPKELTRLPLVESAFNLEARSRVGASGVWQFMRSTGKRYLRIDRLVDERNDPIAATHAAAQLLRLNYEKLGNWPLAVTAYNHGRAGMAKAVRLLATDDLVEIIQRYRSSTFGFASSNFYTEFLAILEIERDYRKYFGKMLVDPPLEMKTLSLSRAVPFSELALACAMSDEEFSQYNPALTPWVTSGRSPVPPDYRVQVPAQRFDRCLSGLQNVN